jgi:polyvinyl alcohol dehydrogenase (cytochrome)
MDDERQRPGRRSVWDRWWSVTGEAPAVQPPATPHGAGAERKDEHYERQPSRGLAPRRGRGASGGKASRVAVALSITLALAVASVAIGVFAFGRQAPPRVVSQTPGDWTTYLGDNARSGFAKTETLLTPATAPKLHLKWMVDAPKGSSAQPIVSNGLVYWGSWDGYEHATTLDGREVWSRHLGVTSVSECNPPTVGVASSATVAPVNGKLVLFVGGGDGTIYALDALTGAIQWSRDLGDKEKGYFLWSSPAVYKSSVYIGVSSFGDCPVIHGGLAQMDAATGKLKHFFHAAPDRCAGGAIWTAPAIDEAAGRIYVATGNPASCPSPQPYTEALVALKAADLSVLGAWQVPYWARTNDGDFGTTPTLFSAIIGGARRALVGALNKNGQFYALDRNNIAAGPVWQAQITNKVNTYSSAAWDGKWLYVASSYTTINGVRCLGSLRALNPATGAFIWQRCLGGGAVFGAVTLAPGLAVVSHGAMLSVIATANGKTVYEYTHGGARYYGPAAIAHGALYQGTMDGKLLALSV